MATSPTEQPFLPPQIFPVQAANNAHPAHSALATTTQPHSPNDLSAAAILTLIGQSSSHLAHYPHSDPMEESDTESDDQSGRIDAFDWGTDHIFPFDITNSLDIAAFNAIVDARPSTSHPEQEIMEELEIETEDQSGTVDSDDFDAWDSLGNTYPLNLSAAFLHPVTAAMLSFDSQHIPSYGNQWELADWDPITSNHVDDFLMVAGKDTFVTISNFFRNFIPHRDTPHDLEHTLVPDRITPSDLRGDEFDMQGIDWASRNFTRSTIRAKRNAFERNRIPHIFPVRKPMKPIPNTENYFSFRKLDTPHQAYIPHFQLRNLMASTSPNDIFFADRDKVMRTDSSATPASVVTDLSKAMTEAGKFQITTLAASGNILMAGGLEGEYALTNLQSTYDSPTVIGRIHNRLRESKSHITNQIHFFESRTNYTPQAVLSSNDNRLRVLDICTNTFTHCSSFSQAVNCSATSPDGRMRVIVGDFRETFITNAETGRPFEALKGHTEDAFACDWADDGIHVATAAQDRTVVIWDARNWSRPLKIMPTNLSVSRILRFSPVGSGPRVLISAEADDFVDVINAQTFESRQVFDFFGRMGGISLAPDGSSLFVAVSEPHFGGIFEFERCGWGEKRFGDHDDSYGSEAFIDWSPDADLEHDTRVVCSSNDRERRGVDLGSLFI